MAHDRREQLKEMSFWDHLDDLRAVLIRVAVTLAVAATVFFVLMPNIFDSVILAPCKSDFFLYRLFDKIAPWFPDSPELNSEGFNIRLINIKLASQVYIHMSTSFWLALVVTFPVILYLLWTFVAPALYTEEKRGAKTAFFSGVAMFYVGVAVGYFFVFPTILRFLADYHVSEMVPNQISLDSYMDTFLMMIFVMGLLFELPLLCRLLGKMGFINRTFFKTYRRHAIVIFVVLAAIITPTGDPFTLAVVFFPIYFLYEMSAFLVPKEKTQPIEGEE